MARIYLFLIPAAILLLSSCAEIIPLTGGPKDETAPATIKQSPTQGMTHFNGTSIELTFDEFIKLNDPTNTITMNPSVGPLTTELKNRTVTISWGEQPLFPNTTYILQLNGAIRDLNEGNDSIMQVVFATGDIIDSLTFTGRVVNAYSNQAVNQVSVGLYPPGTDPYEMKPLYATRSNAQGLFEFSYLKDAPYNLFAFVDQNKDQLPQPGETIAFAGQPVEIGDTVPVVLSAFTPPRLHGKLKVDFVPPGLLVVFNKDSLDVSKLEVNGESVQLVQVFSGDSALVTLPASTDINYRIIYGEDTLRKPFTTKERMIPLAVKPVAQNGNWQAGDSLKFRVNDVIQTVDENAFTLISEKGNAVPYTLFRGNANEWGIVPDPKTDLSFVLHLNKGAIAGAFGQSDSVTFRYKTLLAADLSNLKLAFTGFEGTWIIELTQNEKLLYSTVKAPDAAFVEFNQIEPGQYVVRCIHDANGNGHWDAGDYASKRQAEEVLRYTLTQKIRPNWDIEETLERKP